MKHEWGRSAKIYQRQILRVLEPPFCGKNLVNYLGNHWSMTLKQSTKFNLLGRLGLFQDVKTVEEFWIDTEQDSHCDFHSLVKMITFFEIPKEWFFQEFLNKGSPSLSPSTCYMNYHLSDKLWKFTKFRCKIKYKHFFYTVYFFVSAVFWGLVLN